uniref:PP_kinase_C domain-containing protein n=1 Tax=Strongyloides stercoralis TaxID=6248 RepID=A0A0K0DRZ6_STRER
MYGKEPRTITDRFLNESFQYMVDSDLTRISIVFEKKLMYDCIQDYISKAQRNDVDIIPYIVTEVLPTSIIEKTEKRRREAGSIQVHKTQAKLYKERKN